MKEIDSKSNHTKAKVLDWIFALAIALVACAIAWVGWNFIDSLQKNAGRLSHYHATADNTKIQPERYDVVKKEIDTQIFADQVDPEQALQEAIFKLKGSEITFAKGLTKIDQQEFVHAAENFSLVLAAIPEEAKIRTSWRACGCSVDRRLYTAFVYEQRALCYLHTDKYELAIADLTAAIKLRPDYAIDYQNRAKAYNLLGQKALGAADLKTAWALSKSNSGQQMPDTSFAPLH